MPSEARGSQQVSSTGDAAPSLPPVATSRIDKNTPTAKLFWEVVKRSIPLGLAAVAQMSIGVVLVAMTGKMVSEVALGAATLACGLLNATAFSFAAGFSGALETVLSHSYGRDPNSKLFGVYAQRMSLMLLIIAVFVGPILAFSDSLLIAIGQNIQVARHTGTFCRVALFGVYPVMLLEMMRRYFACQHLNKQLSINLIAGAVSFPFVSWVCLKLFGFYGAAIGWVILMTCMPASLLIYLYATGKYKKTWGGWDPTALINWRPLLGLAFPSMAMMMSEWMSLEVNLIIAGFAPTNDLAAFSIVYQCSGILWSLASGVFIEAAVLVGNALGQGEPQFAKRCAIISLISAMGFALVNIVVVVAFQRLIPRLFVDNTEVHETYRRLLPFFVVYHFFDCVQSCMMGVLRGCGLQTLGALAIALVYSVVGVPVGAFLFFCTKTGIRALWMGPAFGVTVVGFPLYIFLFKSYIPWDKLESHENEIPSLNTSMDQRSMLAYTTTPPPSLPPSEEDESLMSPVEDAEGGGAGQPHRRSRRSSFLHDAHAETHRLTPNSVHPTAGPTVDNTSFTSLGTFYIPSRSILSAPPFFSSSPNPLDSHPPPVLASSAAAGEEEAASRSASDSIVLPQAEGTTRVATPKQPILSNAGESSRGSYSRSLVAPPSRAGSGAAGSMPTGLLRSSSTMSSSQPPENSLHTNLPSSSSSEHHGTLST
ncbi:hypothetical protein ABL78_5592 [Leptomonas seymouri]|uniref:Membrane transporter protein n=1 Tax=Leptomonas seymouri TaxID=5684 RepID=A0A0N1IJ56_LEPSE|nr:hypothetical protein ABL78_5592 [Leptomonas seymouri]|eukprot:KPI85368.1 hypothetical protein ABL78_5592 [Leptomonas seymouri]